MLFLAPVGVVSSIAQGNRASYDPNASADASEAMRQALLRHDEKLHLKSQLVIKDSAMQRAVATLTLRAIGELESHRKRPLPMPAPWLDSLLTARKQRYCLLSYAWGFTRTASNYRGQVAKSLGIGLLSMGMIVPSADKASTRVGVFIYDAQQHAVVYYKSSWPAEKDPLAGVVIDRELTELLAKDFNLTDRI
ncbi:MAG: hypothetical protein JWR44_628 [Hymenobacter sp.]|nr:hypothetical protein [Hymenobacter sp.]